MTKERILSFRRPGKLHCIAGPELVLHQQTPRGRHDVRSQLNDTAADAEPPRDRMGVKSEAARRVLGDQHLCSVILPMP
jgi:hypothetical protein